LVTAVNINLLWLPMQAVVLAPPGTYDVSKHCAIHKHVTCKSLPQFYLNARHHAQHHKVWQYSIFKPCAAEMYLAQGNALHSVAAEHNFFPFVIQWKLKIETL